MAVTTKTGSYPPLKQAGLTYLFVLLAVAIMGIWLAAVGTLWSTSAQREKEQRLLDIGRAYREAIRQYYEKSPGSVPRYPETLDQLLLDRRYLGTRRHLRTLYLDPMTGVAWSLIVAPDGGIMGVHSTSSKMPMKRSGFAPGEDDFSIAESYAEWRFIFLPTR